MAALLTFLIGLSDILNILRPDLVHRLHRINYLVPGTLTNVTRSADVLIGLMLLMLAHGLRRRKRRAWQAVSALLAFDIAIHFFHSMRIPTAVISLVLLIALLYFRDEFYAEGDPRTRWRALWVLGGLVVADIAIGLTYILLARGLAEDYSLGQRVQEVIYGLVGVSGPVQWAPESRGDLFNILTSALGIFTLLVAAYLFLRPAEPRARLGRADADRVRELLAKQGDRDSLGYFALRDDKSVIWSPTGKACICYRVVSGVMLASGDPIGDPEAWPGAIGPFLDEAGAARLGAGRDGLQRARRRGVVPRGRPDRARARRRGDRERGRLQPVRPADAERQADGQPGGQARLRRRGPPGGRHPPGRARRHHQGRRFLARQPHRARLLDGPRPDRHARRRGLRARHRDRGRGRPRRAAAGALGEPTASPST